MPFRTAFLLPYLFTSQGPFHQEFPSRPPRSALTFLPLPKCPEPRSPGTDGEAPATAPEGLLPRGLCSHLSGAEVGAAFVGAAGIGRRCPSHLARTSSPGSRPPPPPERPRRHTVPAPAPRPISALCPRHGGRLGGRWPTT
nr:MAG TPA: hypothetical protein [Caudoviricetes sp.]